MESLLLIYSEKNTPRLQYIFDFVLYSLCGFDWRLANNKEEYELYNGPSINYSREQIKQTEIQIYPNGLLEEDDIKKHKRHVVSNDTYTLIFFNSNKTQEEFFDLFSAAFYLVSRYEEYLEYNADLHNRFEAQNSFLYKYNLLHRPLVNEWAATLQKRILINFPEIKCEKNNFSAEISVDIDQAYAFRHRGLRCNVLSFVNNLIQGRIGLLAHQFESFFLKTDPFDTLEYLKKTWQTTGIPFTYFVNVGRPSAFDKNLRQKKQLKAILNNIKSHAAVGLHPSYYSNEQPFKFEEEKNILESLAEQRITKSRQHYLKLKFPDTYRQLLQIGMQEEYSMGYATRPGFRAGTCSPFFWFDVERNCATTLKIFPITFMEGTLGEDLKMTPSEAFDYIKLITATVKRYNGHYLSIWHNHTVNDKLFWKGWKNVFEQSLQMVKNNN
ncbi:MAG: polysaccharide deacetylase family protein [Chitinophagaceae bacterium]